MASAARSIPSSSRSTASATSRAAAALSRTTSRWAPGSPRRTFSTIRAFSVAVPPASFAVAVAWKPRLVARISWRTMPSGPAWYRTPVSSSGSSSTPSPWMTNVRSVPSRAATSAIRGAIAATPTPIRARVAPAGLVSGPRRLNAVRTPISRRVGPAWRIAGWKLGANRNAKPSSFIARPGRRRIVVDADAERIEDVGRARLRRDRAVAVLGDRHAEGCDHERRGRRDVERPGAVAAGAHDVDRPDGRLHADHALAHRRGEASELVHGLAAHPEAHQQRRELGRASPRRP